MFYALLKLDMQKRNCLFSTLVTDRLYSEGDILTVDIPIRFPGDFKAPPPVPLEFFVCKKNAVKQVMSTHEYLSKFVTQVKTEFLPVPKAPANPNDKRAMIAFKNSNHLVALAESEEAANSLIDSAIGSLLQAHGDCLLSLHITD